VYCDVKTAWFFEVCVMRFFIGGYDFFAMAIFGWDVHVMFIKKF
jgi:hypothetical protein